MESFLLKSKNRISEQNDSFTIHHCYDREKYQIPIANSFKKLISIKDCEIKPNMGILPHRHENMELITVLISGTLVQKNNLGETFYLNQGDVQVMSAGSGVSHFEFNKSEDKTLNCIQFRLSPNVNYTKPKSELITLNYEKVGFQKIIALKSDSGKPDKDFKDTYLYYGFLESNTQKKYLLKNNTKEILILNMSGTIEVNGEILEKRDTLVLRNKAEITIKSKETSKFFLIEL